MEVRQLLQENKRYIYIRVRARECRVRQRHFRRECCCCGVGSVQTRLLLAPASVLGVLLVKMQNLKIWADELSNRLTKCKQERQNADFRY